MQDFARNLDGSVFGQADIGAIEELNKALSPGYGTDSALFTGGDALRPESLEGTLKIVTYQAEHIKFWKSIPKDKAFSTVEEWNELSSYGAAAAGGFMKDGELPETQDSTYQRRTGLVKFMGTTREITLVQTWIRPAHGDVIALETKNGALWLLEKLENGLFWGDSSVIPEEFDGFFSLLLAANAGTENIYDLRGEPLSQEDLETGTRIVADNYGMSTDLFGSYKAMSDFSKQMYDKQRTGAVITNGTVGATLTNFQAQTGLVKLNGDVFLRAGSTPPSSAKSGKAPNAPTVSVSAGSHASSKFAAGDAGNYYWKITAINRYGESAPVTSNVTAVAAAQSATITITDGGGAYEATGYKIYRTPKAGASDTAVYIHKCARDTVTPADTVYYDHNEWLPNTTHALLLQNNTQALTFKQLMPMIKLPLARIAASERWMQLFAGLPVLFAPKKHVVFKNIGPYVPA